MLFVHNGIQKRTKREGREQTELGMRGRQIAVATAISQRVQKETQVDIVKTPLSIRLLIQRICFKKGSQRLQKECEESEEAALAAIQPG